MACCTAYQKWSSLLLSPCGNVSILSSLGISPGFLASNSIFRRGIFAGVEISIPLSQQNLCKYPNKPYIKTSSLFSCQKVSLDLASAHRTFSTSSLEAENHTAKDSTASENEKGLAFAEVEDTVMTIAKQYCEEGITIDTTSDLEVLNTRENRKWDCLDTVEFLIDVENEFGIVMPDDVANSIKTVKETVEYILTHAVRKEEKE
ncbi:hypothetical protein IE077_002112 [Cardiosporidium cionae]|uniref:Carrier domain-containing protein n=1 Tax=Cardiosporidium cionae TaxID=476202 RepID=A0ABQ7JCJ8_9APIC|nr:hypothetical protein IE077_002112 [Cardiosporidium cionae]|eukprot:KAF8821365.1 hypothetical protein IE077_002112 [Cardiosporidium cionae]